MADTTVYLAYPESEELSNAADTFLDNQQTSPGTIHKAELVAVVDCLVDLIIAKQVEGPLDAVGAHGTIARILHSLSGVIRKTSHMLANKLFNGLNADEQAALADHIRSLRLELNGTLHTAIELEPDKGHRMVETLKTVQANGRSPSTQAGMIEVLNTVVDVSLDGFMNKPIGMLTLGRLMRGMVNAAESTIRKASISSNEKVMKGLNDEELKQFAAFFATNLVEA